MDKNNIYNADNPARRKAIEILKLIYEKCDISSSGMFYYELEDEITNIIVND